MEGASAPAVGASPIDDAVLAAGVQRALQAAAAETEPTAAIEAALGALHGAVGGIFPSVFVLEHARLWLAAQQGYAVVPDGIGIDKGVMGRAVRLGRAQVVADVHADADYIAALPSVSSEVAVPLRTGRVIVGMFNLDSERPPPQGVVELLRPLTAALARHAEALRDTPVLDLAALARLFVYLGSLRDPGEIAALAAASLARIVRVDSSQVWLWDPSGTPSELASWQAEGRRPQLLSPREVDAARAVVDPSVVCRLIDTRAIRRRGRRGGALLWLPLRANGEEIGALAGMGGADEHVDARQLDTAAVLAAHVAASLDAAISLRFERQSAVTDALTGILNRRGLEEQLEQELVTARERRVPLSVLVLDCDDFKEINDRAGHEFGDTLLCEVADVLARSVPHGAAVARLGGDEFVVTFLDTGAEAAERLGADIRAALAAGLSEAGYPLRLSGGIATFPFDGATSTTLLRAADQALYFAKDGGKDRVASFRHVLARDDSASKAGAIDADERRKRARGGASVLADALAAARAIDAEETPDDVLSRLCKALVFVVGATACLASRVVDDLLVDATQHALREVDLGHEASYRLSDFPFTAETLALGRARAISFIDGEVDAAEAFILRELGMNAMLMVPLRVRGMSWGLIELYEMRLRRFNEDDVSVAEFLAAQAERRLEVLGTDAARPEPPPVYELPLEADGDDAPRSR